MQSLTASLDVSAPAVQPGQPARPAHAIPAARPPDRVSTPSELPRPDDPLARLLARSVREQGHARLARCGKGAKEAKEDPPEIFEAANDFTRKWLPGAHFWKTRVRYIPNVTVEDAVEVLAEDKKLSVPLTLTGGPRKEGDDVVMAGGIVTTTSHKEKDEVSVTNTTTPLHIFHPGFAQCTARNWKGGVVAQCMGYGTGGLGAFNVKEGPPTFEALLDAFEKQATARAKKKKSDT